MGIALGYAFLLAIAGGLVAICFAWLDDLVEDEASASERDGVALGRTDGMALQPRSMAERGGWSSPLNPQA